ncbi:5'-3' exoribonuclease 2, partial [Ascosphaera aggregata]
MGVPALFRWLSQKYPKIISPVVEVQPQEIDGEIIPVDTTKPNPNGWETDNLYLDMNGIVHPCTHPEGKPPPANEAEMMVEVFKYTDRVVNMARPRKLLMIAVDGVAPRAKMNQQRSRRFRSAQDAKIADEAKEKARQDELKRTGSASKVDAELMEEVIKKTWDSNVITPGTPFMDILSASLQYWVQYKLNTDPAWEKMKVIISDATVPGEGEHKIMEFIRSQRSCPEHDPNTHHVIYGLDADLIMLSLATHEPHFRVLREDVFFNDAKPGTCRICAQPGHIAANCTGKPKVKNDDLDVKGQTLTLKPFIWLHVPILREYLAIEMHVPQQPFPFDLERALDDWVFMCFFVGNDFLPHLPSLDVRENGIDILISLWRENIPIMGGYLTNDGHIDLAKAQLILEGLAKQENGIFKRRRKNEERRAENNKRRQEERERRDKEHQIKRVKATTSDEPIGVADIPLFATSKGPLSRQERELTQALVASRGALYKADQENKSAAAVIKAQLAAKASAIVPNASAAPNLKKRKSSSSAQTSKEEEGKDADEETSSTPEEPASQGAEKDAEPVDNVRLWEEGYAERYYEQKFHVAPNDYEFRHEVARRYAEGLSWVLLYYFQGCPSWTWYYPYHYAPFAADFVDIASMDVTFTKGKPFKPYEQLMGVLPASSNHAIPEAFHSLMTDPNSEIIDFYPEEFPIDMNGKQQAWQGVALLPFIDEKRLLEAMKKRYPLLSDAERARNEMGQAFLFISDRHPLYEQAATTFYSKKQTTDKIKLNMRVSEGLGGKIERDKLYVPHSSLLAPVDGVDLPALEENHAMSLIYTIPKSMHTHKSMLLRGVKSPPPALDHNDIEATRNRSVRGGRGGFSGSGRGRGRGGMPYASNDRPNPFAAHINPAFLPPPHMAASGGYAAPPPPP